MIRNLIGRVFTILLGRMASRAAQLVVFLLLARTLDPAAFGWYGLLTTSILLAALLGSIGLRQAVAYRLGQGLLGHGSAVLTLLVLLPGLVLVPTSAVWGLSRANLVSSGVGDLATLAAVLLATAGALTIMIMQGILLGLGRTTAFSVSDSLYPMGLMMAVAGLWLADAISFPNVLAAIVVGYCVAGIAVTILAARKGGFGGAHLAYHEIGGLIRHGIAFAVNLFLITLSTKVSIYVVERMMSDADAGQFFAGQRFAEILIEIAMSVGMVLFSDTVRSDKPREILYRNARIAATFLWGMGGIGIAMFFFADRLTLMLLGQAHDGTGTVFAIASLMVGPASAAKILYPSLAGMGKPLSGTVVIVACLLVNVGLAIVLIPPMGMTGAALALLVSQIVLFAGYVTVINRLFGVALRDSLLPTLPGFAGKKNRP